MLISPRISNLCAWHICKSFVQALGQINLIKFLVFLNAIYFASSRCICLW